MSEAQLAGPSNPSYLYRLVEGKLTEKTDYASLADYLEEARNSERTFMLIAEDLRNVTGEYVTNESVRRWYRNIEAGRAGDSPE